VTETGTSPARARGLPAAACRGAAALLVAVFLASVARFYHPDFGFTAFIAFGTQHDYELPAVQAVPHPHLTSGGYDGQFYAQLAVEPLLRDPAIDRALDNAPYRARRILLSWTAYGLGLGHPRWILQAYALQNVGCWLLLAWLLTRWLPLDSFRGLALWTACLCNQGMLGSVRLALVDGPSLLLVACAVAAAERGSGWKASGILGLAGLARETNLLGLVALPPLSRRAVWPWARLLLTVGIAVLPLLIWQDYLWSIYRHRAFAEQNQLTVPFTAFAWKWSTTLHGILTDGPTFSHRLSLAALVSLTTQVVYLCIWRTWRRPWWRVAAAYAVLLLAVHQVVWVGAPGAVVRVVLPLTVGFNVLLFSNSSRTFWVWYVLGNLQLAFAFTAL
jgi:hypothetical protein